MKWKLNEMKRTKTIYIFTYGSVFNFYLFSFVKFKLNMCAVKVAK